MNTADKSYAFYTDKYEYTMLESAFRSGRALRKSVFEMFGRRLPGRRRYGVVAGAARFLAAIPNFRLSPAQLEYIEKNRVATTKTLEYLESYSFSGDIWGYPEGEIYFPGSPILTVCGSFADAVLLETIALSIYNHDCAVATAASRMTVAAHGRPCLEMGGRRTHEEAALAAARAAIIGGFSGSSILEVGMLYDIPVIGTAAHSFTLIHDSEEEAFAAQIASLGPETTLLVDTYDIPTGVERAVAAARAAGGEIGAVRIDSGDLVAQAFTVRKQLDDLGATGTKITVTSDLDEYAIAALGAAPVDSYGVGTKIVTGSGRPTAEIVYKLVARAGDDFIMRKVAKKSSSKNSVGGIKVSGRLTDSTGRATKELVVACDTREEGLKYLENQNARPLQVNIVTNGQVNEEYCNSLTLAKAAQHHRAVRSEIPYEAWRLSEGDPGLATELVDITKN